VQSKVIFACQPTVGANRCGDHSKVLPPSATLRDRGKAEILHSGYLLPKESKKPDLPVK